MTDNEIIKALECCRCGDEDLSDCDHCPLECNNLFVCHTKLSNKALSLINRQKAEIERLQDRLSKLQCSYDCELVYRKELHKRAKAEAVKEFADKMHTEIHQAIESNCKARAERMGKTEDYALDAIISYCNGKIDCLRGIDGFVDETYKEIVWQSPDGEKGENGPTGVCPSCHKCEGLNWNAETDVNTCACGWTSDEMVGDNNG